MRDQRRSRLILYNFKGYWRIRAWFLTQLRNLQLLRIEHVRKVINYRSSAWIIVQIFRSILTVLTFSVLLFIIVEKLDTSVAHAFKWIVEQLGLDISAFKGKLDPNFLVSFVGTIAQIAGIFLGLYYTAVGVVVSTAYAQFPNQLRQLLLTERIGNLYIKSTALLATWAILTLSLRGIGYETSRLSFLLICGLSIVSVLSFVRFGIHVFNLYDLRAILHEPYQDFVSAVRRVSIVTGSGTESVHENSRYQAQRALQVFEDVLSVLSNNKFDREKTVQALLSYVLSGLATYAETKGRITSKSKWFPIVNQHRSWLTADASHIATSLHTGTPLYPLQATDFSWVEVWVHRIVKKAFQILLKTEQSSSCTQALLIVSNASSRLVENHAAEEAIQLIKAVSSVVDEYLCNHKSILSSEKGASLPAHLAQVESMHCLLYTELPIAFGRSTRKLNNEQLGKVADQIISTNGRQRNYHEVLPRPLLDEVQRLSELLVFEFKAEGTIITKKWYLQQILGLAAARYIDATLKNIHQALTDFYVTKPNDKIDTAIVEYRCYRLIAAIEALEKFIVHLNFSQGSYDSIKEGRRATDIPFVEIDFESLLKLTTALRSKVIDQFALNALILGYSSKTRSPEVPDFFGQAYFLCLEECRSALKTGDEGRFKSVFPTTFGLAWFAYTAVEKELKGQPDKIRIIYTTEVLEEVFSLSGLAYIYSELDRKEFYKTVEEIWNKHFDSVPDKTAFAKYLLACISYRKSEFGLMPRAIIRSGWDQELSHELRSRGLLKDDFAPRRYGRGNDTNKHDSKLIRVLSRSSFAIHSAIEVFVCLYLLKRSEVVGIDLPASVRSFQESMEREDNDED